MGFAMTFEQVKLEALRLSENEREVLIQDLLNSLKGNSDNEIERAWAEEAERRLEEIRQGLVETVPWDEAMAEIKATLITGKTA